MKKRAPKKQSPPQAVDLQYLIKLCKKHGIQQMIVENVSMTFFEPPSKTNPIQAIGGSIYEDDTWEDIDSKKTKK